MKIEKWFEIMVKFAEGLKKFWGLFYFCATCGVVCEGWMRENKWECLFLLDLEILTDTW